MADTPRTTHTSYTVEHFRRDFTDETAPYLYGEKGGLMRDVRISWIEATKTVHAGSDPFYSWKGVAHGRGGRVPLSFNSILYADGNYTCVRELFEEIGWPFPAPLTPTFRD